MSEGERQTTLMGGRRAASLPIAPASCLQEAAAGNPAVNCSSNLHTDAVAGRQQQHQEQRFAPLHNAGVTSLQRQLFAGGSASEFSTTWRPSAFDHTGFYSEVYALQRSIIMETLLSLEPNSFTSTDIS